MSFIATVFLVIFGLKKIQWEMYLLQDIARVRPLLITVCSFLEAWTRIKTVLMTFLSTVSIGRNGGLWKLVEIFHLQGLFIKSSLMKILSF